ncbi:DUF2325 domain-containing protein [Rhodospirillaceae bacterium KN72]|uniref:DUF2325 domain-containing protein n=1 Tax=Pacificispira spongiicola TaxID=2729598 RepID=A0A7Y0DX55_9PROT|nr:DUF2325 domain-containing protein [Pacificispira spongiicola]NMM43200.1 DUF2325 domain-containing protein [Pacificispira spongiicola]
MCRDCDGSRSFGSVPSFDGFGKDPLAKAAPAVEKGKGGLPFIGKQKQGRKKLWEIDMAYHCAVIGTCFSIAELKKLGSKYGVSFPEKTQDYTVHGFFVEKAKTSEPVSKAMYKALEKKYAVPVRQLERQPDQDAQRRFWADSQVQGGLPGAFWAFVSAGHVDAALVSEVFGEVHMLSHGVAQATAKSASKLTKLAEDAAAADQALRDERKKSAGLQAERDDLANRLTAMEEKARRLTVSNDYLQGQYQEAVNGLPAQLKAENDELRRRVDRLERERAEFLAEGPAIKIVEKANPETERPIQVTDRSDKADFKGQRLLYIGGVDSLLDRYKTVAEEACCVFMHHDGGNRDCINRLDGALERADFVVVPIECVSHSACKRAKQFCKAANKRFLPVRTPSVSALAQLLSTLPVSSGN